MNAWKIVCATLVIFITGIITGASLVRFAERGPKPWPRMSKSVANFPGPSNSGRPNNPTPPNDSQSANATAPSSPLLNREFVQVLSRQLRLTTEQREQIDQIMADGQKRMRELRAGLEPQIRKQLLATREQIHALLIPEQRELFDQLMKQRTTRRNDGAGPPERERRFRDPRNPMLPREGPPGGEAAESQSPTPAAPPPP